MKTIIIYASTYGYAKDCAITLSNQFTGEVLLVNIATDTIPLVEQFDNVVIGGSIYMGQISKKIKTFCTSNIDLLKDKRVGLFICCGLPENLETYIKNSFPEELIKKAISIESFGGELRLEKMKFAHKMLTKLMQKSAIKEGKPLSKQLPENITKLASSILKLA